MNWAPKWGREVRFWDKLKGSSDGRRGECDDRADKRGIGWVRSRVTHYRGDKREVGWIQYFSSSSRSRVSDRAAKSALFSPISLTLPLLIFLPFYTNFRTFSIFLLFTVLFQLSFKFPFPNIANLICDGSWVKVKGGDWFLCREKQRIHISCQPHCKTSSHLSKFPLLHQHNGQITLNQFVPSSDRHKNRGELFWWLQRKRFLSRVKKFRQPVFGSI